MATIGSVDKSSPVLITRLAIMMFLQFFIWGAWYVAMWGFMNKSGMAANGGAGAFVDAAYTVAPIAAIIAPLTLGLIADRFLNSEKVLAILFLVGAALLFYAPKLAEAGAPTGLLDQFTHPMILCLLAYMVCFMPTLGLTASLSFSHLKNGEKEFPIVRVLGTIGWIVGNWAMWGCRIFTGEADKIGEAQKAVDVAAESGVESAIATAGNNLTAVMDSLKFSDNSPHIFTVAAIASLILGVFCLTLPKTAPPSKGEKISLGKIVGVDAWGLLKDKSFLVFALASMLICIPLAGYYAKGYGFVGEMKVNLFGSTTGAMSTGQMSEIVFMLIMPLAFARLGVKWMLTIGMAAWVARYGLWGFAFGQEGVLLTMPIFVGIMLHGICYDFFFVTGMIYTDKKAPAAVRSQAQSLVVMLTQGVGLGIGAQLFGRWTSACTKDKLDESGKAVIDEAGKAVSYLDFTQFWYVPAAFAAVVMVLFIILFWDKVKPVTTDGEVAEAAAKEEIV